MLTVARVEVLQGIRDVESTPSSECVTVNGSDDVRGTVRDGVRMDAKRQHQPVREDAPGCEPVRSCMFSIDVSWILVNDCAIP